MRVALRVASEVKNAVIVSIVCDRGDRYLSTGVFPLIDDAGPRLRHRDGPRRRGPAPAARAGRRRAATPTSPRSRSSAAAQATGSDFLPRTCSAWWPSRACCASATALRVWSLGEPDDGERELIQRFFDGIEKYTPQLVSWNGSGFDLPVLHYRALIHGVAAPRYWDMGEDDSDFKYNNYISRFHTRHIDLMDVLAMLPDRARARRSTRSRSSAASRASSAWTARRCGRAWQRGEIGAIRNYCETDVANTYLALPALPADARRPHAGRLRARGGAAAREFIAAQDGERTGENSSRGWPQLQS